MSVAESPSHEYSGNSLLLGSRVEVYPDSPTPNFNSAGGTAYAARMRGDLRQDLMAIVCTSGLPARLDAVNAMRTIDHPSLLRLRESGVLYWPPSHSSHYVLAYDHPLAPRYQMSADDPQPLIREDTLNHYFVTPMIGALLELQRTGIVHGAIRSNNIFWRFGGVTPPQLGECLSAPTGIGQPVLFETIERGMCNPSGRGPGIHTDDCYAFGITLALAVLGHNPLKGLSDREIIHAKLERGTFGAIVGTKRLATSHIEILRGLLTDEARQRWTAADLEQWLSGRRLTPKNVDSGRRASRHFTHAGKDYWQIRPLAASFSEHVGEAVKLIENSSLEKWLLRSLGDEDRSKEINEAISQLKESGRSAHYDDQLVTRVCIALDPGAPIRYRGVSVMPSGISTALAEAMITGGSNAQILAEIINSQFVTLWVNTQNDIKTELVPLAQQLERMRGIISKTSLGNGLERAAYELNPTLPCISPMLKAHYVTNAKQLLPALEAAAAQPGRPREPMDRHLAAFLVVRDRRGDRLFEAMSAPEGSTKRGLALLTLFGELQYRHGPEKLPALAGWLAPMIEPCVKDFISKSMQEKLKKQVKEAVEKGDLSAVLRLVDDPKRVEHDTSEFVMARRLYNDIQREIAEIESHLADRENLARSVGGPIAATMASAIAIILITFTIGKAILRSL